MAKSIMIQGAGSNVGKSLLVAGLARAFVKRGLSVLPFKPQNMSNNAAVTSDGGEIGRAQALQARAAGVEPLIDMNPVLLKPESEIGAQVIVQGKRVATVKARDYAKLKPSLMAPVLESYGRMREAADLVLVEGAGSPAEINLRQGDIANMGFAVAADCPVVIAGDIDRGGVIAQLVGTHSVLPDEDRAMIAGFLINKFRGDVSLFDEGLLEIAKRTAWASLGVVPWFGEAHMLPAEDALDIKGGGSGALKIVVPMLPRIANFDDLDPLKLEPNVRVEMLRAGEALPGDTDVVILPGSKSTIADLAALRREGWDVDIAAHLRRGGHLLGICGGYQMLGQSIEDPEGIEGPPRKVDGLGHLDVSTVMVPEKHLSQLDGRHLSSGANVRGYEIHIGETTGPDCARPWLEMGGRKMGAARGRVMGAYLHGLFSSDAFRAAMLESWGGAGSSLGYEDAVDGVLDQLAEHLEASLDLDALLAMAR